MQSIEMERSMHLLFVDVMVLYYYRIALFLASARGRSEMLSRVSVGPGSPGCLFIADIYAQKLYLGPKRAPGQGKFGSIV